VYPPRNQSKDSVSVFDYTAFKQMDNKHDAKKTNRISTIKLEETTWKTSDYTVKDHSQTTSSPSLSLQLINGHSGSYKPQLFN